MYKLKQLGPCQTVTAKYRKSENKMSSKLDIKKLKKLQNSLHKGCVAKKVPYKD